MGKNKVMSVALGSNKETEYKENLHRITRRLVGNVGLMFSNSDAESLGKYFDNYRRSDYARAGFVATETVELPEGPLMCGLEPMVHSMEPTVRGLGLPSLLQNGDTFSLPPPLSIEHKTLMPTMSSVPTKNQEWFLWSSPTQCAGRVSPSPRSRQRSWSAVDPFSLFSFLFFEMPVFPFPRK